MCYSNQLETGTLSLLLGGYAMPKLAHPSTHRCNILSLHAFGDAHTRPRPFEKATRVSKEPIEDISKVQKPKAVFPAAILRTGQL